MEPLSTEQVEHLQSLLDDFFKGNLSNATEIFAIFDRNKNGALEATELQNIVSQLQGEEFPMESVLEKIKLADANNDGVIDLNEFIQMLKDD